MVLFTTAACELVRETDSLHGTLLLKISLKHNTPQEILLLASTWSNALSGCNTHVSLGAVGQSLSRARLSLRPRRGGRLDSLHPQWLAVWRACGQGEIKINKIFISILQGKKVQWKHYKWHLLAMIKMDLSFMNFSWSKLVFYMCQNIFASWDIPDEK